MAKKVSTLGEIWAFLRARKKWWLGPIIVIMILFGGLLVLSLVRNLLEGDPAKRLAKLQEELRDRELDLEQLRAEIAEVEQRLAAKKQKMDEASGEGSCNSAPARPP